MSRAFAMPIRRPYSGQTLSMPLARRGKAIERGVWMTVLFATLATCVGLYVYEVQTLSQQGFAIHALQVQRDRLQQDVAALQDQSVQLQTIQSIHDRIQNLGYVASNQTQYIDLTQKAYAMAR